MAKYTIKMGCGHTDTVELFGKDKDRKRKIEYFEEHGLCKECYKKEMQAQAEKEGLVFNATILPRISESDGDFLIYVWFSGNTLPHKDEIKALGGYKWEECQAASNLFSISYEPCWGKTVKFQHLKEEIEKAKSIGAKDTVVEEGLFASANYMIALDLQKKWQANKEQIDAIPKPIIPEIIKGHYWNGRIYGKSGNYCVYLDKEKTPITDEQKKEITAYLTAKEEYNKKVNEVTNA